DLRRNGAGRARDHGIAVLEGHAISEERYGGMAPAERGLTMLGSPGGGHKACPGAAPEAQSRRRPIRPHGTRVLRYSRSIGLPNQIRCPSAVRTVSSRMPQG